MKRKLTAILLVLCICISLVPSVFAAQATLENSVDMNQLVAHGISMFKALEAGGRYDTVGNFSGTVGMGIMGWIGSAALQLLKWCASPEKGDPQYTQSVLGDDLYYEVVNAPVAAGQENQENLMPPWNYWIGRAFSSSEIAAAKLLLSSDVGIVAQNMLAETYIRREAKHGWNAGVRTEAALLYYCSAENHYGEGNVKNFMASVRAALGISESDTIDSLEEFHQGAVLANVSTLAYRTKVYNYLKNTLGLDPGPTITHNCPSKGYTDVPGEQDWAHAGIDFCISRGIMSSTQTNKLTFEPNAACSRAMIVSILYRLSKSPAVSYEAKFSDVPAGNWYTSAVIWAYKNGITKGYDNGRFGPDDMVTREQMAVILKSYTEFCKKGTSKRADLSAFSDAAKVTWSKAAMQWAVAEKLISGKTSGGKTYLDPQGCATRAEVASILMRLIQNILEK